MNVTLHFTKQPAFLRGKKHELRHSVSRFRLFEKEEIWMFEEYLLPLKCLRGKRAPNFYVDSDKVFISAETLLSSQDHVVKRYRSRPETQPMVKLIYDHRYIFKLLFLLVKEFLESA